MFAAINSFLTGALAKVTDVYWPFVSMLLHGDGTNAAQNNTFLDGSTNNFTVTRNGNTTQGSFNPFVSTYPYAVATNGGSAYFDGTGDYLTVPDNAAFTLGTNAFTFECWINISNPSGSGRYIAGQCDAVQSSASTAFGLYVSSASVQFESYSGATYISFGTAVGQVIANTWVHLAWVRDTGTNTLRIYVNGVQQATLAIAGATALNNSSSLLALGQNGEATFTQGLAGYISNFRLVNGTCLYPSGTTFTPPTAPLTAVTNTALLLGMSNGAIFDNTMLNNLETVANAQISTSVFKYGTGALKFNGTTDYLPTPDKVAFTLGANDFTVEAWIYATATGQVAICGQTNAAYATANTSISFSRLTDGRIDFFVAYNSSSSLEPITTLTAPLNTWTHVAAVRDGATLRVYVGGVQSATATISTGVVNDSASSFAVGRPGDFAGQYFPGYIDDFRFTKGVCRYPSGTTFTPPTAAFPNLGPTYPSGTATQRAIFGFGENGSGLTSVTNIVSNTGVAAGDTTGVGTVRGYLAASSYGGDKAIFGFGYIGAGTNTAITNLVSNAGVVASDTTGVGTARASPAAARYSTDKAIFGYGAPSGAGYYSLTNLVTNTGVVATDTTGIGTARRYLAAASYSTDKAIFGYGSTGSDVSITNLVSNTGVVSSDTTGVGTARNALAATGYGSTGQAIFGYGYGGSFMSMTNLVSNIGIVATDTTGVGSARNGLAAAGYGGDKAIFGYGQTAGSPFYSSLTNLVSNTGVVATDTTGVGTARYQIAAAGFSYS